VTYRVIQCFTDFDRLQQACEEGGTTLDGTPALTAEITVGAPVGRGIIELNAARAVNSVPRVVEADLGCRSVLDFPAATGGGAW